MRRNTSYVSPEYFESGNIGRQTANEDDYFESNAEPSVRMVLDNFVQVLPEYRKTAVEMCVMAGLTYEEAAEEISLRRGIKTDKKTVWRWARAGVEDLKLWLSNSPWVAAATNNKIPVDQLDQLIPVAMPWEEEDGS